MCLVRDKANLPHIWDHAGALLELVDSVSITRPNADAA